MLRNLRRTNVRCFTRFLTSLGKRIGNVVVHKILVKYTNKPESIHYLESEVETYRDNVLEIAQEYNWNEKDLIRIKKEALDKFTGDMANFYKDVNFPIEDVLKLIEETIKEVL